MTQTTTRTLIPRIRRAVEGVAGAATPLTDDAINYLAADAIADIILYSGTVFGKDLVVTDRDVNQSPTEYATTGELTLPEQSVIASQAALNNFYFKLQTTKISESIADEAQTWDYSLSAQALRDALRLLIDERNLALESLEEKERLDRYTSFIAERDVQVSRMTEPWVWGYPGAIGGQQIDVRFGSIA